MQIFSAALIFCINVQIIFINLTNLFCFIILILFVKMENIPMVEDTCLREISGTKGIHGDIRKNNEPIITNEGEFVSR